MTNHYKYLILMMMAVLGSSPLFAQKGTNRTEPPKLPSKGICAHRGAVEKHPENTIAAFKEAIRLGAQMIEFDVRLSKDKQLVIMHDTLVDRTTNGSGYLHEMTLRELKRLDAGSWKSIQFKGEKIPTLQEVLEIIPDSIWLNIHLKGGKKLGRKTAKLIVAKKRLHQAILACEKDAAKKVRKVNAAIKMCNMERSSSRQKYIDETLAERFAFIQLKKSRENDSLAIDIARLKKNGVHINYVQAETPNHMRQLLDQGIDFVLTDHLTLLLDAFSNNNQSYSSQNKNSTLNPQ